MRLFKNDKWLKYIFELELILITSIVISIFITLFLRPEEINFRNSPEDNSGILEKYRIFSTIINIKPSILKGAIEPGKTDNSFVNNFLTLRSLNLELKDKSYGIIDDFIANFKESDNYLKHEKEKLHLKNLFTKKKYSDFIKKYNDRSFGFDYDIMLLKSNLYLKNEKGSLKVFKDLYIPFTTRELKEHLTDKEISELMNKIEQSFWNRKLEVMVKNNSLSDFRYISKYIKDKRLVNFISAEISYSQKKYSRSKTLLSKIRSARFTAGKEKLLLKMRIRDDNYSDIDQTLEKIMSDKDIYRQLLLDIAS
ncbi:MAG: hypothetical protein KAR14_00165, partial [Candidatus Aminicenantes bacterium]|nr:hypothetical protein [Candidatus Aminicenantes bacterium]